MSEKTNGIATAADWRSASRQSRAARAEELTLPSGARILAARPEPLEWILAGRLPQRLLSAALAGSNGAVAPTAGELSREDVLELARFAAQLVQASVVRPAIGEGPNEIALDDIPIADRAFIFEWACRALGESGENPAKEDPSSSPAGELERFCAQ
jgi:hypothetical protein